MLAPAHVKQGAGEATCWVLQFAAAWSLISVKSKHTSPPGLPLCSAGCLQMWALRLALQLARSEPWCARFTAAGGVASAAHLAGVLGGGSDISTGNAAAAAAVQLSALQLLVRLVKVSHTAAAAVLASRRQALDGLMATMLAAGSLRPTTPAAGGAKVKVAAGADAAKQVSRQASPQRPSRSRPWLERADSNSND